MISNDNITEVPSVWRPLWIYNWNAVHAVTYTCPILPEIASRLLDDDPMELESRDLDGNMVDKKRGN